MTHTIQTEQALWRELAARGEVQGELVARVRTPWAVRALMGAAGWLGALFFQMFFLGAVFVAVRENAGAIALTGLAMIVLAAVLYQRGGTGIALGQFALAVSLSGQGMVIYGVAELLGGERLVETAAFWVGLAVFEAALYVLVPNRLHRFLAALGVWIGLAVAMHILLTDSARHAWLAIPWSLGWLAPGAFTLVAWFTVAEARLCAVGRHVWLEPAMDATLLFALGAALVVTGASHPLAWLDVPGTATHFASARWLAGTLVGAVLVGFALVECRRLALPAPAVAIMIAGTAAFGAVMVAAPAVSAGALALGLALRRASLPWLGLGITAIAIGFIWYYSSLHWTLLAKSVTLAAAGVVLIALRQWLVRAVPAKEVA
ncbi:hypothetical protein LMG23992_03972 [Cupriavidus laharis]|uniref:DUF4401 domain-containing protein n=1 Tax=Cupriavidus laharis TaxID=151654 RepID=A0ABM8XGL8_9BURK|nr:DUF4401 domain-containing protein [Cupriavidus laharis]CAG9179311.1 hypothetical protein LMG23992_03972 [Cupriavidus laharis]